jgi:DNA-damage-inducible protein J
MNTRIQARIDESLKIEGEAILKAIGLTTADLIRMTFKQVVMLKGLPFDARIPNAETIKAFEEAKDPKNLTTYPDVKTALDDMWGKD